MNLLYAQIGPNLSVNAGTNACFQNSVAVKHTKNCILKNGSWEIGRAPFWKFFWKAESLNIYVTLF